MLKPIFIVAGLGSLSLLSPTPAEFTPGLLKEESIAIEYTATSGECTVVIKVESETPLRQIAVCPKGERAITELRSNGSNHIALSGLIIESEEFTTSRIFEVYPEGEYEMLAQTSDGRRTRGGARLSHQLPAAPTITYPQEGLVQVPVNPTITWAGHPEAMSYTLGVEQNGDDRLVVILPPGTERFKVPAGVLEAGTETLVEVGALGANGNCTFFEVRFFTN